MNDLRIFATSRRLLLGLALGIATLPLPAAPLPEVVGAALDGQPEVLAAEARVRANRAIETQARSAFLPDLSLSWSDTDRRDEQLGAALDRSAQRTEAALRWNVFRGYADVSRRREARAGRSAAQAGLIEAREAAAESISLAYLDVLQIDDEATRSRELIEAYRRLAEQVSLRVEAGRISRADLARIDTDLLAARARNADVLTRLADAKYRFLRATGQSPTELEFPAFDGPQGEPNELVASAERSSPALAAAHARAEAREFGIGVARGEALPRVDLELRRRLSADIDPAEVSDTVDSTQLAISVDIPLGGASLARIDEALERRHEAQAEVERLRRQIGTEVNLLYRQLVDARDNLPLLTERARASRRLIDAYALQFDAGRRSLTDLANAHADEFGALTELSAAEHRIASLQASLLARAGQLTDRLRDGYHAGQRVVLRSDSPAARAPLPPFDAAAAVDAWAAAWSAGDFPRYRAFYAPDFQSGSHADTAQWEAERRLRLGRSGIRVGVTEPGIERIADDHLRTRFIQRYESPQYSDTVAKILDWAPHGDGWVIVSERAEAAMLEPAR